jgi:hypothetical protein
MKMQVIQPRDIQFLEEMLINDRQLIEVLPYSRFANIDRDSIRLFLHKWGVYCLPTTELIEHIYGAIIHPAIEIGCGTGALGRALGIPITDSCLQRDNAQILAYYKSIGQPLIHYPKDVECLTAEQAIKKYKPKTVIGSYITHKWTGKGKTGSVYGVVEGRILSAGIRYINIGNDDIHYEKPILKYPHSTHNYPWLITRSDPEKNYIKIWN